MEKKLLDYYVVNRLKSAELQLSAYAKDRKPERLHLFRVEIKKIKAVFSFFQHVCKEKNNVTKLKPLFDDAGAIRELQINIHLLLLIPDSPKRLVAKLQKRESNLVQKLINIIPKYSLLLNEFRKEIYLPELKHSKKLLKDYFKKKKRNANKLLKIEGRENLHCYRIKLKKIMYLYNALPKKIQSKIELNASAIKNLEKKLGDWHDFYTAIAFLSQEQLFLKTTDYFLKLKEKEEKRFTSLITNLTDFSI